MAKQASLVHKICILCPYFFVHSLLPKNIHMYLTAIQLVKGTVWQLLNVFMPFTISYDLVLWN